MVQLYSVGNTKSKHLGSVYQQHIRHIQNKNVILADGTTPSPKELLAEDILAQLQCWKKQGDQVLLMANANKHIITGKLGKALTGSKWDL